MKNRRGFTLIELLIVIAILGVIASIILVALEESRKKGRDANRASQVQELFNAAELYYSDHGRYPDDGISADNSQNYLSSGGVIGFLKSQGGYMSAIPADPTFGYDANDGYLYCSPQDGDSFTILVHAESGNGLHCTASRGPDNPASYCDLGGLSDCTGRF